MNQQPPTNSHTLNNYIPKPHLFYIINPPSMGYFATSHSAIFSFTAFTTATAAALASRRLDTSSATDASFAAVLWLRVRGPP